MKTRVFLLAAMLLSIVLPAYTQASVEGQKSASGANWFLSAGGGLNLLVGEQDHQYGDVFDRLGLDWELSAGKWFHPTFGMRLQLGVGRLKGFNYLASIGGEYTRADRSRDLYPLGYYDQRLQLAGSDGFYQQFHHGQAGIDLLTNLSHLFRGYYRETFFEFIPFAGLGYIHAVKSATNPTFDYLFVKAGARAQFNLNRQWSLYLEPQANLTGKELDGYVGHRDFDGIVKCYLGVQFHINKGFSSVSPLSREEINLLNEKLNRQQEQLGNQQEAITRVQEAIEGHQRQLDSQQQQIRKIGEEKAAKPVVEPEKKPTPPASARKPLSEPVRFKLNSAAIELSEKHKLETAAAYMKAHPGAKLLLTGYADLQTGNRAYNYELSCKRVASVARQLTGLGVDPGRLSTDCVGDQEQPYVQNDWNRVVIMVAYE